MSYFTAAVVSGSDGWAAAEIDLRGAADVEEIADRLRDVDPDADVSLLFIESDDAYLAILRLDDGEKLRVFGSDSAFAKESRLGAVLLGDVEEPVLEINEMTGEGHEPADEEPERPPTEATDTDPIGDPDLLADLGVPARRLLVLCASEGMLPSDVTAEICQALGCGDELEELREA